MIPIWLRCYAMRVWDYFTLKHSLLFSLCLWALYVQAEYRVPTRLLFVFLPWVGLGLSALSFLFMVNHILKPDTADAPFRQTLHHVEKWAVALILAFVLYSVVLYGNGNLDASPPTHHASMVLSVSGVSSDLGLPIAHSWMNIRSWENPDRAERLLLKGTERGMIRGGEAVIVQLRSGNLGIPWVSKIELDAEHYSREVLKVSPAASLAWKNLIQFYLDHQRWKDAAEAAYTYLKLYSNDYDLAINVGIALFLAGQREETIPILDIVAAGQPKDWRAYYRLGKLYASMGMKAETLDMFEKTLELKPVFPEVESAVASLRQALAATNSSRKAR